MAELVGRRVASVKDFYDPEKRQPGDYCKVKTEGGKTIWYVRDPLGNAGSLRDHTVEEHDDGTITVTPSILDAGDGGWHGWLTAGVWKEA